MRRAGSLWHKIGGVATPQKGPRHRGGQLCLGHQRSSGVTLTASSLVRRRLAGTQLLPVDLEGEVREVGRAVPEVEQLRGEDISLPSSHYCGLTFLVHSESETMGILALLSCRDQSPPSWVLPHPDRTVLSQPP